MYTGIVDHCGIIIAIRTIEKGLELTVSSQFKNFVLGESIALNGICVTVTAFEKDTFKCQLSPETLNLTTAKTWKIGDKINLERSLTLSDRLGGHFVMGHVDTVLTVEKIIREAEFTKVIFAGIDAKLRPYFVKKGSVCVNGVSLTINQISEKGFEVMLIPHTQKSTNLQFLHEGDGVNIEFDTIARVVVHQMNLIKQEVIS